MAVPSPFLSLIERSVIVQGIVTLAVIGADIYLAVTGRPIPELLSQVTLLVLGFYFGSKVGIETAHASYGAVSAKQQKPK